MKIICPEHGQPIEVADKAIAEAFNKSKVVVFYCPVCREKILIDNIRLEKTGPEHK